MKRALMVLVGVTFVGAGVLAWAQDTGVATTSGRTAPIVGSWKLNKDMTDKPLADNARGGDSGRGPAGIGGGGGGIGGRGGGIGGRRGGGMGGGGYEVGRTGDPDQLKRMRRLLADLIKPAAGWTIVQDGPVLLFTNVDGRTMKYTADGKEEEHLTGDGVIKSRTRWNGEQLVIESKYQDGPKVAQTYTVSSDLRQLMIHIKITGGGTPREVTTNQVYERHSDSK